MKDDALFNCCEGTRVPDWSQFYRLEVGGSRDHDGETESMVAAPAAEFFTVYGRRWEGNVEPITDVKEPRELLEVAAALACLSDLTVTLHASLASDERLRAIAARRQA